MKPYAIAIVKERRTKLLFFVAALLCIAGLLAFVKNMLVSFILAFVTYYLLAPFVDFLERRGFSRLMATVIPFLLLTLVLVIAGIMLFPLLVEQSQALVKNAPQYIGSFNQMLSRFETKIETSLSAFGVKGLSASLHPKLSEWTAGSLQYLPDVVSRSLTVLLLVPFFAFFMLLDGRDFIRNMLSLVPNNLFEMILDLNYQIGSQVGGFIRARLLESVVVGVIVWIGLLAMDFPYALLLGVIAGIVNVIPYVGPLLGALPAFLILLSNGGSTTQILLLSGIYGIAQIIDAAILVPFFVAKIVDLHPVTVVLAVIVGSQLMGIVGMIICIPLVSAMKVTVIAVYRHLTHFRE